MIYIFLLLSIIHPLPSIKIFILSKIIINPIDTTTTAYLYCKKFQKRYPSRNHSRYEKLVSHICHKCNDLMCTRCAKFSMAKLSAESLFVFTVHASCATEQAGSE